MEDSEAEEGSTLSLFCPASEDDVKAFVTILKTTNNEGGWTKKLQKKKKTNGETRPVRLIEESDDEEEEEEEEESMLDRGGDDTASSKPLAGYKFSLLEVCVMINADLETIQLLYSHHPKALNEELVSNSSRTTTSTTTSRTSTRRTSKRRVMNFLKQPSAIDAKKCECNLPWVKELLNNDWSYTQPWTRRSQSRIASNTYSALEIVLMMRAELDTIQEVYHMYPEALRANVIRSVCKHNCQPGVLGFLAQKIPHALSKPDPNSGDLPLCMALLVGNESGERRHDPDDLIKLVELYPQAVNAYDRSAEDTCWEIALFVEHPPKVLDAVFQHCSPPFNELRITDQSRTMDIDSVNAMSQVLPRIDAITIRGETNGWKGDAFLEWIRLVGENETIQDFTFQGYFQVGYAEEDKRLPAMMTVEPGEAILDPIKGPIPKCGLQSLNLNFSTSFAVPYNACIRTLLRDIVPQMPHLISFTLQLGTGMGEGTPHAVDCMCQLLRTSKTLSHLDFLGEDDSEDDNYLPSIIQALDDNDNSNLAGLRFGASDDNVDEAYIEANMKRLLGILQTKNTKLRAVLIFERLPGECMLSSAEEEVYYYTALNTHGRETARDPNTELADFVKLLDFDSFHGPIFGFDEDDDVATSMRYGLLRESPTLWSGVYIRKGSQGTAASSRKRKR